MKIQQMLKDKNVTNAILIGTMCSFSYLAVYFARNLLSAVTPQMVERGVFTAEFIGSISSAYFITYALGQLINGAIGDRIKARYMISIGLFMAGAVSYVFVKSVSVPFIALIVYAMTGFFLSMIYGPMTKVVAENTNPIYAVRCSLGYTFASFVGTPLAGVFASALAWDNVFNFSSVILITMSVICFTVFLLYEKKGIIKYNQYKPEAKSKGAGIQALFKRKIVKFTFIAILTGIIRTTVVFWMPTYINQYLGFSTETSALIFTVATFIISMTTFVAIFIYERIKRDINRMVLYMYIAAFTFFLLVYTVKIPVINIAFLVLAIMSSNSVATVLYSIYCPSLRDTGMVSGATGFLDFTSYVAAAVSSSVFANAVSDIGWGNLILVWMGLMAVGIVLSVPDVIKLNKAA